MGSSFVFGDWAWVFGGLFWGSTCLFVWVSIETGDYLEINNSRIYFLLGNVLLILGLIVCNDFRDVDIYLVLFP